MWRLRWHPHSQRRLAAACMHEGFVVVDVDLTASCKSVEIARCRTQGSLAYGIDWCVCEEGDLLVSCTFYDRHICVWTTAQDNLIPT